MDFGTVEKKEQAAQAETAKTETTKTSKDGKIRQQDTIQLIPPAECKGVVRLKDEPFEDYKKRRKVENLSIKHYLRGRMVRPAGLLG